MRFRIFSSGKLPKSARIRKFRHFARFLHPVSPVSRPRSLPAFLKLFQFPPRRPPSRLLPAGQSFLNVPETMLPFGHFPQNLRSNFDVTYKILIFIQFLLRARRIYYKIYLCCASFCEILAVKFSIPYAVNLTKRWVHT